ncbi:MAG: carnitine dehydratase [Rhodospirillaceae bacterium]|nr:carnitine dehydratase [Rhodospirillaceae bacterium]
MTKRILEGVRVIDLTQFFVGPHATLLLAGLGAEVIRVDNPATGDSLSDSPIYAGLEGVSFERKTPDDLGVPFLKRARGKKAVTLNLKHPEGVRLLMALSDKADVLVENFSVGVTKRLGIDFETMHRQNPRLVYCSITGYGQTGPDAYLKCFDAAAQAASGLMSMTGQPGGPPTKAGTALADSISSVFGLAGILAALYHQERTGEGQHVDVAMVDSIFSLIYDDPLEGYQQLGLDYRQGNRVPRVSPFNSYKTKDRWLIIGTATDVHWQNLCDVMGCPELKDHPDYATSSNRLLKNDQVDAIVAEWAATQVGDEAMTTLRDAGIVCSPINDIEDVKAWPHIQARGMIEDLVHPTLGPLEGLNASGYPIKFSGAETGYRSPPVMYGNDNAEIFCELLGLDAEAMEKLLADGVI